MKDNIRKLVALIIAAVVVWIGISLTLYFTNIIANLIVVLIRGIIVVAAIAIITIVLRDFFTKK